MTRELPSFQPAASDAFSEGDHPRAGNGQFGSGGGGEKTANKTSGSQKDHWSESRREGRKEQQRIDLERADLRAGALPAGWKMVGGRKVPPPR